MNRLTDFFTNLAHTAYFGPREPTRAHHAEAWMANALYLSQPQHTPPVAAAADVEEVAPRHGQDARWRLQRCLVTTVDRHTHSAVEAVPAAAGGAAAAAAAATAAAAAGETAGGGAAPTRAGHHLRIVSISDTHMKHKFLRDRVPQGDVLIHCGDILMTSVRYSDAENLRRVRKFNRWLGRLPHAHKLVIAGNHDGFLQRAGVEATRELLSNATYLCDEAAVVGGVKIWGSPVSWGHSHNDAFQQDQDEAHVARIPVDADVIVTHGFPFRDKRGLRRKLQDVQPALHLCGHWHHGAGVHCWGNGVVTVNCSMLNGKYRLRHPATVIDLPLAATAAAARRRVQAQKPQQHQHQPQPAAGAPAGAGAEVAAGELSKM